MLSKEALETKRKYNREYQRKWRKENKDKVKKYNDKHWELVSQKAAKENN